MDKYLLMLDIFILIVGAVCATLFFTVGGLAYGIIAAVCVLILIGINLPLFGDDIFNMFD